ncbi:hypothetical protein RHMOL_Rhmol10G0093900 [Rhododendron molle]|uniref:Uncharacterized protein n=1 Tax=Rhododendron molle TaxID=49168 RepID=A0ACC0M1M5_RHOML|nr:hypothetical protein RHMOL_Rhmol10G0093900 [Rhododendron molle]
MSFLVSAIKAHSTFWAMVLGSLHECTYVAKVLVIANRNFSYGVLVDIGIAKCGLLFCL